MSGSLARHKREISVAGTYAVMLIVLAVFAPSFFRNEFAGTWVQAAPVLVAAVGMTLVIVARQIDISIGSQFCICGVCAGLLAKCGLPVPLVAVMTIVIGVVFGMANGLLIAVAGLPSIVVTLAMMVVLREALRWAREGEAVRDLPGSFQWFGLTQATGEGVVIATAVAILVAFAWGLSYLQGGPAIYAVGSDTHAARLAGIRPRWVTFVAFAALGGLVGVAALLNAVRFPQVDVNAGIGLELQVIAAVVVGGVAINGGRGTLLGALVGVALLTTIGPALTFLNLPPQWERAVQGFIILAAIGSERFFGKRMVHA